MKQSNKKLIIRLFLLLTFIFIIHMFTDDEINPEAQRWLDHYGQKPDLEQNAFIELIALGQDGPNPYQVAKQKYLEIELKFKRGEVDYDEQLKYPVIVELPVLKDNPIYCTFEKPDCFAQLNQNKALILNELQGIEKELIKFSQLASYTNFDRINSLVTEPQFEVTHLYRLLGIQAYYLITAGELDQAATLIANLIKLERKFLTASSDVMFVVSTVVHSQILYTPLIKELHIRGFNNWHVIQSVLTPLKINEISVNRLRLQEFADSARILQLDDLTESALEQQGVTNKYLGQLIYKKNITINKIYKFTQAQLIDESTDKRQLLEQIEQAKNRKAIMRKQMEQDANNITWTLIKNIRNIGGTLVYIMTPEPMIDVSEDIISADLRILLLNVLMQSQTKPIQDIIDSTDFINPYNGEKPYLDDNKICLRATQKPECVNISLKSNEKLNNK